jgi:restriction system protein
MPIPDYQKVMFPLLKLSFDNNEHSSKETVDRLSNIFNLTEEKKEEKYDTKNITIFYDRVHWALSYLKNACLMEGTKRGFFKITSRGKDVLKQDIIEIDKNYLKQFPEFN